MLGCCWILLSDWITFSGVDVKETYWFQTVKGLGYVFATAGLLFLLIRRCSLLLSESEKRFSVLVESAPDAVLVESEGRIAYMNAAALRLIGATSAKQVIGRDVLGIIHPVSREVVKERIASVTCGKSSVMCQEETYMRLDGSPVTCEVSAVPIRFGSKDSALMFIRDATERKFAQEQQSNVQKMELVQQLAGKLAHALNNLVQVISGNAELARTSLSPDVSAQIYLGQVLRAGRQASDWVGKIMAFSNSPNPSIESLEMSERDSEAWTSVASVLSVVEATQVCKPKTVTEVADRPTPAAESHVSGASVVLLAEDDEMVRRLTERFLKRAGYSVMLARDGVEAVELFEANGGRISAAVLDVVMPRMNGFEAYERMRVCDAKVPVVFASGFSGYRKPENLELIPGVNFLQKPFDCNELVAVVRLAIEKHKVTATEPV